MKTLHRKPKILLALTLLLFASGCNQVLPEGMGRKPRIKISAPVQYSPEEMATLQDFGKANPTIAKKIIGRNNEMAAAIDEYNKGAAKTNYQIYKSLNHTADEARAILKATGFTDEEIKGAQ